MNPILMGGPLGAGAVVGAVDALAGEPPEVVDGAALVVAGFEPLDLLQEAASRTADATTKARDPTAPHPCPVRLCAIRFPPHKVGFGEIRSSRCPWRQLGQYSGDQILVR